MNAFHIYYGKKQNVLLKYMLVSINKSGYTVQYKTKHRKMGSHSLVYLSYKMCEMICTDKMRSAFSLSINLPFTT